MPSLGVQLKPESARVGGSFYTTSISYVGRENNTEPLYPVSNWSLNSVPKKYSPVNRYGTSGFYQIRPGSSDIGESVAGGNNLGISAGAQPTLFSHPSFANVVGGAGTFVNFGGYPNFLGNDGVTSYRQGALSISIQPPPSGTGEGPYNWPEGENAAFVATAFTINMTQDAVFMLGVAVDTVNDRNYAPRYVSVFSSSTETIFSAPIPTGAGASVPRLPLFIVRGKTGDQFIVGMWQGVGVNSYAPFSLITFDRLI